MSGATTRKDLFRSYSYYRSQSEISLFEVRPLEIYTNKSRIQCYCLRFVFHNFLPIDFYSDIHADAESNQRWCQSKVPHLKGDPDTYSIFIVPGDVGSSTEKIQRVLELLADRFDAVCYLPGNHEAWRASENSEQKLAEVLQLAQAVGGVHVGPVKFKTIDRSVIVLPLYAWYHGSWDTEPDITHPKYLKMESYIPFSRKWGDFSRCSWPASWLSQEQFVENQNTVLAEVFAKLNEKYLRSPPLSADEFESSSGEYVGTPLADDAQDDAVISFSHFVPRIELMPEKRFLYEPGLMKVIGSDVLRWQVERLRPHLHLFGHTHIPIDLELDGIRYIQWPLGYSREAALQCKLIVESGPLLVYDTALGSGDAGIPSDIASLQAKWSVHYRTTARDQRPEVVNDLAEHVLRKLDRLSL